MKKLIFSIILALSLVGCVTAGYVNVNRPSITGVRHQALQGSVYRIVLSLSNPETHAVKMQVNCYPTYIVGEVVEPITKTVTLEPRSDKDVSVYTMGSVQCELLVVE